MKTKSENISRLLSKIAIKSECWIFKGSVHQKTGYGKFCMNGKGISAHRASAILYEIPNPYNKACVCHTCDNPPCINPKHLFWGTHKENTHDMMTKGRFWVPVGYKSFTAKLSDNQVVEIRTRYQQETITIQSLADCYAINYKTCWQIIHRQTWKHVL